MEAHIPIIVKPNPPRPSVRTTASNIPDKATTLEKYIEGLLKEGKRGGHEQFQQLFRIYGKEKVTDIAKPILDRIEREKKMPRFAVYDKDGKYLWPIHGDSEADALKAAKENDPIADHVVLVSTTDGGRAE